MSKLNKILLREIKHLNGEKLSIFEKLQDKLDESRIISYIRNFYYDLRALFSNLPMFIRFAWSYRSWDYTYNIHIFSKLLEDTARNILEHGSSVNNVKIARRAFTAAGMLRKAYVDGVKSRTHRQIYKKYGYPFDRNYVKPPDYMVTRINRILKTAADRENREEVKLKEDAWKYINKYIEHFWD